MSFHSFLLHPPQPTLPEGELSSCRALVIDTNQTSRSVVRSMLADLGLRSIAQATKISEARRILESRTFDVVLCDYHFEDSPMTGTDLVDELRRAQMLPYSTVFIMITGEASYVKVAEAAESALDSYLLKPHNVNSLSERLYMARHRKMMLSGIFEAIEREEFDAATQMCLERFRNRGEYWIYAARIGGELLLRLSRHDEARELFAAIDKTKAMPWARLGIARAQLDAGQIQPACRTLETLLSENPTYADAYDVMGRAQLQTGAFDEAYETYRHAAQITPASVSRLQKVGMLAYYMGDAEEAGRCLERASLVGTGSKMFDYQSLMMLAQIRFDQKDYKGLQRCQIKLMHAFQKQPESNRLRRMAAILNILSLMLHRRVADVLRLIHELVAEFMQPDFDFEAASNMLGVLTSLRSYELHLPEAENWVRQLCARFCVSKPSSDILAMIMAKHKPYAAIANESYKTVVDHAEKALGQGKDGAPDQAVRTLLVHGSQTKNAKLLDLAEMVLNRYRSQVKDPDVLAEILQDMRSKYCRGGPQVHMGNNTGRQAGALNLRN